MNSSEYPSNSQDWSDEDWQKLLTDLIDSELISYKEVTALVLGHLNPPQVGTSIATNKNFQRQFPRRKCWEAVRQWHFNQNGKCADCGTRFELQADHIIPKQLLGQEADKLENLTFRCRRCNVIKRPSHKQGGLTDLTAEAALMWLLFTKKPATYQEFAQLCRAYGMTMADIRFQEAWAMAKWLERKGKYFIHHQSKY
ncbi:MAG: HNH endonuclease [Sphaerospermopsis kisseleviana]